MIAQLRQGRRPEDRAYAVGNLQSKAWELAQFPEGRAAAIDLLERFVLPSASYCRILPDTSSCFWRSVIAGALSTYEVAGSRTGQERCLEILLKSPNSDDRDLSLLQLGRLQANAGQYRKAIDLVSQFPKESRFAPDRDSLVAYWDKRLVAQKKRKK